MSLSRLLLVAANSKKRIKGDGNDEVKISPKLTISGRDAYEGEVVLCFQLDEKTEQGKRIRRSLDIQDENNQKRCDGLVFYSRDEKPERVICLVEMKSTNDGDAPAQLESTREHIKTLLSQECNSSSEECRRECERQMGRIVWKACIYHHGASPKEQAAIQKELKDSGFRDVEFLDRSDNDLRPLLSGEGRSAKEIGKRFKNGRRR